MTPLFDHPRLADAGRFRTVEAGRKLFGVGDEVDSVVVIVLGVVLVRSGTPEGDTGAVDVRGRGDLLGNSALLDRPSPLHLDGALTLTPSELLQVPLSAFDELRDDDPEIGAAVIAQLTDQARRLSDSLIDRLGRTVRSRAARKLSVVAAMLDRSEQSGTDVVINQRALAELIGTTRATLNAQLGEFQSAGALHTARGRVCITDPAALTRFH